MKPVHALAGSVLLALVSSSSIAAEASAAGAKVSAAGTKPFTRNVAIVVYEGVELLDFAGPTEVFTSAAGFGARGEKGKEEEAFRVYTVAVSKAPITSQGMLKVMPEFSIDDAPAPDIVVLPGGNSKAMTEDPKFMAWIERVSKATEVNMSVCTGAFVWAKLGLLDGKSSTTWYGATDKLQAAAPKSTVQEGRRLVDNGHVLTTAGVSAGIDGALHLVARLLGRQVADKTAQYMEYHWTPEAYLAKGYVATLTEAPPAHASK
ncbi:MAG: DJ-1/PfpI family protein [Deltaproteobacteria bacterium]|nr:DJ-1/PfpI family protein [Deltaproteobacteria bacterium]